jgi:hypothetical protein
MSWPRKTILGSIEMPSKGTEAPLQMLFDSVPGHHFFDHLQALPITIVFQNIPIGAWGLSRLQNQSPRKTARASFSVISIEILQSGNPR